MSSLAQESGQRRSFSLFENFSRQTVSDALCSCEMAAADRDKQDHFLQEKGPKAPHGDIICRCAYPMQLHPQITLPWFCF
jgi:hypothetical protein